MLVIAVVVSTHVATWLHRGVFLCLLGFARLLDAVTRPSQGLPPEDVAAMSCDARCAALSSITDSPPKWRPDVCWVRPRSFCCCPRSVRPKSFPVESFAIGGAAALAFGRVPVGPGSVGRELDAAVVECTAGESWALAHTFKVFQV